MQEVYYVSLSEGEFDSRNGVAESRDEFHSGITMWQAVHQSIHPSIQQRRLSTSIALSGDPVDQSIKIPVGSLTKELRNFL
jgi:hypothetical protein